MKTNSAQKPKTNNANNLRKSCENLPPFIPTNEKEKE